MTSHSLVFPEGFASVCSCGERTSPIQAQQSTIWISAAACGKSPFRHALGRGDVPISGREGLLYFRESGYRFLAVAAEHAVLVDGLPARHNDPFDRILVAEALVDPMRLITHDPQVARYSDTIIKIYLMMCPL